MKKKGFTLMELLAVIVILAVLALLVIPITTNLIKTSKKEAFRISVGQVSDNIYFHYASDWILSGMNEDKVFNFETNENLNLLTVSGQLPTSGTMTINPQGKIDINVNNGVYCAVKTIEQDKIQVGEIVDGVCDLTGESVETCDVAIGYIWNFDYIDIGDDRSQEFSIPCSGNYKLEVWGAQGGTATLLKEGGYGGYSTGEIVLKKDNKIYINVGGQGTGTGGDENITAPGGYNGGGSGHNAPSGSTKRYASSGGGATHIALESGLLSTFENKQNKLLIVSGGGAGVWYYDSNDYNGRTVGHAGGFTGVTGTSTHATVVGADQETGFAFGQGANNDSGERPGGGGGYYGGMSGTFAASGGSGYIGNNNLKNKNMYCFNCTTSPATELNTYTKSDGTSSCVSDSPVQDCAKKKNGYARITYLGKNNFSSIYIGKEWNYIYSEKNGTGYPYTFTVPVNGVYKIELWGAQGGSRTDNKIGGKGSYTSGEIELNANYNLYIYVGGAGETNSTTGTSIKKPYGTYAFNGASGGNYTCYSNSGGTVAYNNYGGAATDVRITSGAWDNSASLASRIMVAAGGSAANENENGIPGGALNGKSGTHGTGATQTSGGGSGGTFGKAGYSPDGGNNCWSSIATGAGSGYYGGGAYGYNTTQNGMGAAGSGSSYISGYTGCVAIKAENNITKLDGCDNGTTDVTCSYHYSKKIFSSPVMKAGDELMPNHEGGSDVVGNTGNGYARITLLEIK